MDTRQFEYVLAIAEEKYISKAAEKMCISQPTLSQFLSKLEGELGIPLFVRSRRGFAPTKAGELYIDGARRIIGIQAETYAKLDELKEAPCKRLVIGLSPGRTAKILSCLLPAFNRDFPDVKIQVVEALEQNIIELIKKGFLDFSMIMLNPDDDQLVVDTFVVEEVVMAVNRMHPLAHLARSDEHGHKSPADIRLFADDPFILLQTGTRLRSIIDKYLLDAGVRPSVLMETSQNALVCNMVLQGLGVGFIPAAYARQYPDIAALTLSPPLSCRLGVTYRKGTRVTEAMRRFFALAREFSVQEANGALPG